MSDVKAKSESKYSLWVIRLSAQTSAASGIKSLAPASDRVSRRSSLSRPVLVAPTGVSYSPVTPCISISYRCSPQSHSTPAEGFFSVEKFLDFFLFSRSSKLSKTAFAPNLSKMLIGWPLSEFLRIWEKLRGKNGFRNSQETSLVQWRVNRQISALGICFSRAAIFTYTSTQLPNNPPEATFFQPYWSSSLSTHVLGLDKENLRTSTWGLNLQ